MTVKNEIAPVNGSRRYIILDALRGFALLGICMANFPEFSLYSFLKPEAAAMLPSAALDFLTKYFIYIFIDGKFYTIFSLLFGIGFSIIISNAASKGRKGLIIFYRRMLVLLCIGFLHLMLLWSGDILMLYALIGMILPLFMRMKNRGLLISASIFLVLPVVVDLVCQYTGIYLSKAIVEWQGVYCDRFGITEDNFAYWLLEAKDYDNVFKFLIQGAIVRLQEFVDGNRYFKVLGLFLIGFYIGRNKFYASLQLRVGSLKLIRTIGLGAGLPLSVWYAWSCIKGHPWGVGWHSLLYLISVYITSFGYIAAICLLYICRPGMSAWKFFAYPGRMALTNYIGQSAIGMFIFYGIGLGFGAYTGLFYVEIIAVCSFLLELVVSRFWLSDFQFGPLEWVWRCLTYLRIFPLLKRNESV